MSRDVHQSPTVFHKKGDEELMRAAGFSPRGRPRKLKLAARVVVEK